jgi:hypothetical protein
MRQRHGRTALAFAVMLAAAAIGASEATPSVRVPATAARDCTSAEARAAFDAVVATFNAGDVQNLDQVIEPAPSFVWFSDSGAGRRLGDDSKDRSTLAQYFKQRRAQRDRLSVVSWRGGGNANGYSHFQFFLNRSSRDELPSRYEGKGAVICTDAGNRVAVWSMGRKSTLPLVAPPARLPAGSGWLAGSTRIINPGCAGCIQTETWASTVRYRDPPNQLPPHRTMAAMRAHDVVVHVTRSWEPSAPPWTKRQHPLRILRSLTRANFEGNTTHGRVSLWTGTSWRAGSYVSVWVLFSAPMPAKADIARAQRQLDRATFAPWHIPQ